MGTCSVPSTPGFPAAKGTYVRTLAEDIARKMGSCAHLEALRRLGVGPFREADMIGLEELAALAEAGRQDEVLQPPDAGLVDWPVVTLTGQAEYLQLILTAMTV